MPIGAAIAAITGNAIAVIAVFDVTSPRKTKSAVVAAIITIRGAPARIATPLPIHAERPVLPIASARDSPPPNRSSTPHGIVTAVPQSRAVWPRRQSSGTAKRIRAQSIAIVPVGHTRKEGRDPGDVDGSENLGLPHDPGEHGEREHHPHEALGARGGPHQLPLRFERRTRIAAELLGGIRP